MGRWRYGYVADKTMCVSVVYTEMQLLLSQKLSSTKYNHMVNAEGLPQILFEHFKSKWVWLQVL